MTRNGGVPALPVDPRARRSKEALEAALLELVAGRDLSQVSIADITKHAGVSRSTFYEHYTDVHDLAAAACELVYDQLVAGSPMMDPLILESDAPEDNPLVEVFTHFAEHAPLYRSLLGPDGSARVINHLLQRTRVRAYTNRRVATPGGEADDPSDVPYDPEAALIAGALIGTVIDWLRRDCPVPPQELAAVIWPQVVGAAVHGWGLSPRPRPAAEP